MKCCTTVDKRVWSSPTANRRRRHESSIVFESFGFSKLQLIEFSSDLFAWERYIETVCLAFAAFCTKNTRTALDNQVSDDMSSSMGINRYVWYRLQI